MDKQQLLTVVERARSQICQGFHECCWGCRDCPEATETAHVTSLMQSGARSNPGGRAHVAMLRKGDEVEETEALVAPTGVSCKPKTPVSLCAYAAPQGRKGMNCEEVRCHNCYGMGHMKGDFPSPINTARAWPARNDFRIYGASLQSPQSRNERPKEGV